MKKMFFALMTMLTVSISVNAMSYEQARNEALFLTDCDRTQRCVRNLLGAS